MSMPATDLRTLFYGPNAGYVLDLYDRYESDPDAVDGTTREFFDALTAADIDALITGPKANGSVGHVNGTVTAETGSAAPGVDVAKVVGAATLATAIRDLGHLAVQLDPLGTAPPGSPELDRAHYGLTEADLAALPAEAVGGPSAKGASNAAEAIARLDAAYTGTIGYDLDHVQVPDERAWLRDAIETGRFATTMSVDTKRSLLDRLTEVEAFETFLHQTYLGQKRFSLEGNDVLVPMLDEIISNASSTGTREVVLGMAHRGRLNVLTHVLGKPYEAIIGAFEGTKATKDKASGHEEGDEDELSDATDDITGDVKYHLGARLVRDTDTGEIVDVPLVLAPNPSHLEAVNPIVVGMTRASQDRRDAPGTPERDGKGSLAILLHGDAAFPGQGVVAETLNLSGLRGYTVGGTVHIIVNNQIGYTTDTLDSRSTLYAGDLAKGFEIPIFHVNADSPEACLTAVRLALAYREQFGKDVLIDQVGYRRWGHNEGDEPSFTQPLMYAIIQKHPTVRAIWAKQLEADGVIGAPDADQMQKAYLDKLAEIRKTVSEDGAVGISEDALPVGPRPDVESAVSEERLRAYDAAIHKLPDGFKPPQKLVRQWERRSKILDNPDGKIDWAHGEALAFASILADGTPIRLTGQDAERGTFSQRHMVLHDATSGDAYNPLQFLPDGKASLAVYNSPLSENAAVGFEYGYTVHSPETLVLWEAQFGDFANGAQVVIDQFLASARAKWQQEPALTLLLPHGYEGQGPEHSSARLERFLQLVARDNLRVANCTTAAQYFHLLRRQAALLKTVRRPLVVMTPKSLLRHPLAASPLADLTSGKFQPVLDDATAADRRDAIRRLVLCSGKVWVDLEASPDRANAENVAIARVEMLAPFQMTALSELIGRYPNLTEIVWLQEEPRNMGAWTFMDGRLRELVEDRLTIRLIGRPFRASPAEGSAAMHTAEQNRIVAEAFADVRRSKRSAGGSVNGNVAANGRVKAGKTTAATTVAGDR